MDRSGRVVTRVFLSTPSARRATGLGLVEEQLRGISIHALREEGDLLSMGIVPGMCLFLSTPSARRATNGARACLPPKRFLSTPSARRATRLLAFIINNKLNFYPRPPRGGRRRQAVSEGGEIIFLSTPSARRATCAAEPCPHGRSYFYPRPPRGGRRDDAGGHRNHAGFLSTPSARRATPRPVSCWASGR